jgi:hypothetical protein
MGRTGKLFKDIDNNPRREKNQDLRLEIAQDFERLQSESKAYHAFIKRISDMRDVAMYHVMLTAGEPIGACWKAKLVQLDEVLGVPEEFMQKGRAAEEENEMKSVV